MSLNGVVRRFAQGTFEVARATSGRFDQGRWIEGVKECVTVRANVQPMSGKDLKILPEGIHPSEALKVYSLDELRTAREGDKGFDSDLIKIHGETFKVVNVQYWTRSKSGGDYFEAIVARVVDA